MTDLAYKRMWIWQKRHTPEALATKEHRKVFRVFFTHIQRGRCIHCGILMSEAPRHNCYSADLHTEAVAEFVTRYFLHDHLEEH